MPSRLRNLANLVPGPQTLRRRQARALIATGNDANIRRDWATAEAAYAAVLKLQPRLGKIWIQYGHSLKEQGFLRKGEDAYRRAIALDNADADAYLQLGHVLKLQGFPDQAEAAYRGAHLRDPASPHSRAELVALGAVLEGPATDAAPPPSRPAQGVTRDEAFVAALRPREGQAPTYLSLDHLLDVHGLNSAFVARFDAGFYFHVHPAVRHRLGTPGRERCLVDFCERGIDDLLSFDPQLAFDPAFYREAYLGTMPFTSGNAYRHWLNLGFNKGWASNRHGWVKALLGKDVGNLDAFDVALAVASVDRAAVDERWPAQFERLANGAAADPRACLAVTRQTAGTLAAIADRLFRNGARDKGAVLYQRVLDAVPDDVYVQMRLADALLQYGVFREAAVMYQNLLRDSAQASAWTFLNLAHCHAQLGRLDAAMRVLHAGGQAFPGDPGLAVRFADAARAYLAREWDVAFAEGRLGRFEAAQARLGQACAAVSGLLVPRDCLPPRHIRRVALVGNQDLPQCRFYRVDQKLEHLAAAGFEAVLFDHHTDLPAFLASAGEFDAAIFYRVPALFDALVAISKARELGLVTFYEIDDLIFEPSEYPGTFASYGGQISSDEYVGLKLGVPLFRHAMSLCDYGLASTPALAKQMGPHVATGRVFLHQNAFGRLHETHAERLPAPASDGPVTVFYGSGTKANKEDFEELVEPALVELVRRHGPRVNVLLMGYLNPTARLRSIEANVTFVAPNWDIGAYWAMLGQVDVNIAVLKPSLMADCKSAIKWLEAAMLGIPSVVSSTATYREVVRPGETGLICTTPDEWTAALGSLVADAALRRHIGAQARQQAYTDYGLAPMAANIRHVLEQAGPPAPPCRKPTVLVVNVFYPPQAIGGATRVVHDNVCHLHAVHGGQFDLEVFTTIEGGSEPYKVRCYVADGVKVTGVTTPVEPDIDSKLADPRMAELFTACLDRVRPALVHFHCIQRLTASIVAPVAERGLPYLVSVHDGWWISDHQFLLDGEGGMPVYEYDDPLATLRALGQPSFDRMMQLRPALLGAASVLAVSEPFARIYRKCGVPNVETVANGVSALPQPERTRSPDGKVRLAFVGGLSAHKGYKLLQYAMYGERFSNLRLMVVDHSLAPGETRQETWGTVDVDFRPKVPQRQIGLLYGQIDVLLAPSVWPESYGLVTREALHCGCWVVASDRGSIGEYVSQDENGFIVDVSGPEGLVAALKRIDSDPARYTVRPAVVPPMREAAQQGDELAALYGCLLADHVAAIQPHT